MRGSPVPAVQVGAQCVEIADDHRCQPRRIEWAAMTRVTSADVTHGCARQTPRRIVR